jgi:hypothetical protein
MMVRMPRKIFSTSKQLTRTVDTRKSFQADEAPRCCHGARLVAQSCLVAMSVQLWLAHHLPAVHSQAPDIWKSLAPTPVTLESDQAPV